MLKRALLVTIGALSLMGLLHQLHANDTLMQKYCGDCHNDTKAKGKFKLRLLGNSPSKQSLKYWLTCRELVSTEEMPPAEDSKLSNSDRKAIVAFLDAKLTEYEKQSQGSLTKTPPRRLNNREFANSVRDVLLIEDIGTNQPTHNLIGDTLHHGFDTHADSLGFSRFHMEQYIEAVRKIVDATILSGQQPPSKRYDIPAEDIIRQRLSQNARRPNQRGENGVFDFLDPRLHAYFNGFETVPETGYYSVTIRCTGKDRFIYDTKHTGIHAGDPIQLSVHLGDRVQAFDLPDEEVTEVTLSGWMAKGSRLELRNPTDGLRNFGNSNFKFQYRIVPLHLKEHHPERYTALVEKITNKPNRRRRLSIDHWSNWTDHWQGPRPQVFGAIIEGPHYESWPPKRQIALLGQAPKVSDAAKLLKPIAERAWRRPATKDELEKITSLVQTLSESHSELDALKEGIVAILVSPAFLLIHTENSPSPDRFATKLSYALKATTPNLELREAARNGQLDTFDSVRGHLQDLLENDQADSFLKAFPYAWMELNDINFMAPDPDQYRFYHRKRVSEDMIQEVLRFFRHIMENNLPIPEFLAADYSFINADLAKIYGVEEEVPKDSQLRKYTFTDGRRGGLLGMAAFLTATADSLTTSPIHRAVYVMENFMGIQPTPPPPDIDITEPDVRQAKTIKEVLAAHVADESCASCHQSIDPWGYAFEHFDPTGAWRDTYSVPAKKRQQKASGLPVDASATFRNGIAYHNIREFREQLLTQGNRDRFVRCFISKLLTYANGIDPNVGDFAEIDRILATSADHSFRIVETIAAVIDSPLFRVQ